MEQLFDKYGLWALLGYVLIKDGLPFINNITKRLIPIKAKEKQRAEQQKAEAANGQRELQEREVVAQEMIGKNLILMNERQSKIESGQQAIMTAMVAANQSLSILLDREGRTVRRGA